MTAGKLTFMGAGLLICKVESHFMMLFGDTVRYVMCSEEDTENTY